MAAPIIALLTDFGLRDTYVGVMKGVIKSICPEAELIDLTHDIPPQGIAEAAFLLGTSHCYFPDDTVFLCVVDPGVGSDRAALAVETERYQFVAPDNGLLSLVWRRAEDPVAHSITRPRYRLPKVSQTFHGRDIFAPAAAHLAAGVPIESLGEPMDDIEQLSFAMPLPEENGRLRASVLHIDHFGNIISNVRHGDLPPTFDETRIQARVGDEIIAGLLGTYSAADPGQPLIHWGSSGHLEIAIRGGSAAKEFGLVVGSTFHVECPD